MQVHYQPAYFQYDKQIVPSLFHKWKVQDNFPTGGREWCPFREECQSKLVKQNVDWGRKGENRRRKGYVEEDEDWECQNIWFIYNNVDQFKMKKVGAPIYKLIKIVCTPKTSPLSSLKINKVQTSEASLFLSPQPSHTLVGVELNWPVKELKAM